MLRWIVNFVVTFTFSGVQNWAVGHITVVQYGFSARALTPYPTDLNHCRNFTLASEDGLKESPKHVSRSK
jgi:hypothetical protein